MLRKVKKIIKVTNNYFAQMVLFIFYFLPLALISILIKSFFFFKKESEETYWKEPKIKEFNKDYLESPY